MLNYLNRQHLPSQSRDIPRNVTYSLPFLAERGRETNLQLFGALRLIGASGTR